MTNKIRPLIAVGAIGWIASGLVSAGIINADSRGAHHDLYQSQYYAKKSAYEAIVAGVIFGPVSIPVSYAVTGGAYFGWTLSGEALPCTSHHPEVWCRP